MRGTSGQRPDDGESTSAPVWDIAVLILMHSLPTAVNRMNYLRICFRRVKTPFKFSTTLWQGLSRTKRVVTAHEPDGRQYSPAIIRAHYGGYTYKPHFDSVRLREKREGYAVHDFEHQFAGVMVLQNTQVGDVSAQCVLHQYLWQPEIDSHLRSGTFHEHAAREGVASVDVILEPGDLYFFNTRNIHEVPGVAGDLPRIVLATFIGYSSDRDDIFVWS